MKKSLLLSALLLSFMTMTAYAEDTVLIASGPAASGTVLTVDGAVPSKSVPTELPPELSGSAGTGAKIVSAPETGGPGVVSDSNSGRIVTAPSAASSELMLDGLYVTPAYWRGDVYCAESGVSDGNGGWSSIPTTAYTPAHDFLYKLIREEGDWYICAYYGSELRIKKSDARLVSSISVATQDEKRKTILKTAISLLGTPYRYGGNGPDSFDCSGFVNYCYEAAGISVPRSSADFGARANISESQLQPGDVLWRSGHVGIYLGDGKVIHSEKTGTGVRAEYLNGGEYNKFVNLID